MRVLVACECSGHVREAFRKLGHDAWSCDLKPAEDNSPFHIQGDVLKVLASGIWHLLIAHPPCTYLSVSGIHWNGRHPDRPDGTKTEAAAAFFMALYNAPVHRVAIENPVCVMSTRFREADQTIQPYNFGEDASKRTCLWLRNLPQLSNGLYVPPRMVCKCGSTYSHERAILLGCPDCGADPTQAQPRWANQTDSGQNKLAPSEDRAAIRATTYPGIARAFAAQWGHLKPL